MGSHAFARRFLRSARKCVCTAFRQEKKKRLTGGTDVDATIEVAVGTWVTCNSFDQALTCHPTADPLMLAVNKTATSITSVSSVPSETVTALASTLGTTAAAKFSQDRQVATRTSRLDRGCVVAGPDDPDRRIDCEEATFVASVSYHLADVATGVLLASKLT